MGFKFTLRLKGIMVFKVRGVKLTVSLKGIMVLRVLGLNKGLG